MTRADADPCPPGALAYRVYVVESAGVTCSDLLGCSNPYVNVVNPAASMLTSFAFAVSQVNLVGCPFSIRLRTCH